jgi:dTDP-4-dehydrorhamnose reductase
MTRRAVVFGAAGQLGVELVRELQARGYATLGFDRGDVDITDGAAVENAVAAHEAEVVFNCAAYNQVDVAEREPEAAFQINALAVRHMALACRQADARLVQFSTDYVFDGYAHHPYAEDDHPHPLSAYAVSKLAGELYARAYLDSALIVRTSGVYGPGGRNTARGNFVELMMRLASSRHPIRVVEDHVASPTFAPLLAARATDLVERGQTGLFHIGGGAPISWFQFARLIFQTAGVDPLVLATNQREYRTAARRPRYSALSNAKMERLGLQPMPSMARALEEYFSERAAGAASQAR